MLVNLRSRASRAKLWLVRDHQTLTREPCLLIVGLNKFVAIENRIQFDDSASTSHDMAITMVTVDSACQIGLDSRLREDLTIVGGSSWGVDKIAADYFGRKSKIILVIAILPAKIWPRE